MNRFGKTILGTSGGLIALYLVVKYWYGAAQDTRAGGSAATNVIKAFQGR